MKEGNWPDGACCADSVRKMMRLWSDLRGKGLGVCDMVPHLR
jgi:hypothetical protein